MKTWHVVRKLLLGVALISIASSILLISDRGRRRQGGKPLPRVAIFQYADTSQMDKSVEGMIQGLADAGFVDGRTVAITRYSAQNDMTMANSTAALVTDGRFDMVLTASTPCLQVVANANKAGKTMHVFGAVTDPFGAGVGISPTDPLDHPRHLVGVGTFQPVERAFEVARQMYPDLKRVGVVWNASEACSEACTRKARAKCKELGIQLLEVNVDSSNGVSEAAKALVSKGAQAIWIGGDTTVIVAVDAVVAAARAAGIPVFSNNPDDARHGVLFALGAEYVQVGRQVGEMAAGLLKGGDPAAIRIENIVPEELVINTVALRGLKDSWQSTPELLARADHVIGISGTQSKLAVERKPRPGRVYKIGIVYFGPDPGTEAGIAGLLDVLQENGFIEGENLKVFKAHAQGEIANITPILQNYASSDIDLIVPMTTPCLTAACTVVKNKPCVFTVVYDPLAAGAGTSATNHLPHVTGVGSFPPMEDTADTIQMIVPKVKRIGTIYNSSEANSRKVVAVARELFAKRGWELEEVTVTGTNDVFPAAQAVVSKSIDALWVTGDNTALQAFEGIGKVADQARIPFISNDPEFINRGPAVACGLGFYESGRAGGRIAIRVLLGEDPASIPIEEVAVKRLAVNFAAAARQNATLAPAFLKQCVLFGGLQARQNRAVRIALVQIVDNPFLDKACQGVLNALRECGLNQGADFTVKRYNAQGEAAQLPTIMQSIRTEEADLIVTCGTPVLIAAAKVFTDVPIVFTVASDPNAVGVFPDGKRQPNVAGVHDDPPVDRLLDMAAEREADLSCVGTIWDPSQPNSEISVKKLRVACKQRNIKLLEAPVAGMADISAATQSLCDRGAKIIVTSADNLTTTGFPAIVAAARSAQVAVYTTEPGLVELGATGALGDDYGEWGRQSGRMAAKVLAGVSPSELEVEKTAVQRVSWAKKIDLPVTQPASPAVMVQAQPQSAPSQVPAAETGRWRIALVCYNDSPLSEDTIRGIRKGLTDARLVQGQDYELMLYNAQGDMATLSTIMDTLAGGSVDLVMTVSTPTLQAAIKKMSRTPIVFATVASAIEAGAGSSEYNHLPNVTGVTTLAATFEMADLLKRTMPAAKRVGTLFTPSEANSVFNRRNLEQALQSRGIELVSVPVSTTADVNEASIALCNRQIDAVCQIVDNLTSAAFSSLSTQASKARLPIFSFISEQARQGGMVAVARDYEDAGRQSALVAARVLRGQNPADIPFTNVRRVRLVVNLVKANELGMKLPDSLIHRADEVLRENSDGKLAGRQR